MTSDAGSEQARHSREALAARVARNFLDDVINKHDPSGADRLLADGFIDHSPLGDIETHGKEALQEQLRRLFEAFPDMHARVDVEVAAGDMVAWRATHRAHHRAPLMGIPASGREVQYTEMHIVRVNDEGKVSEHWAVFDGLGLAQQLGVVMGAPLAVPPNPPHRER